MGQPSYHKLPAFHNPKPANKKAAVQMSYHGAAQRLPCSQLAYSCHSAHRPCARPGRGEMHRLAGEQVGCYCCRRPHGWS